MTRLTEEKLGIKMDTALLGGDAGNYDTNLFNTKPTETMTKVWDQLLTLEKQTYTNIIYGKQSIDTFDDFVAEWKAGGGDQITQEVSEWYHSVR